MMAFKSRWPICNGMTMHNLEISLPLAQITALGECLMDVSVSTFGDLNSRTLVEWEQLFEMQTGPANPFTAPDWARSWYEAWSTEREQRVYLVRSKGELIGVAPMQSQRVQVGPFSMARRIVPIGTRDGSYALELPQLLVRRGEERKVLRAATQAMMGGDASQNAHWVELSIPIEQGWFEPEWVYDTQTKAAYMRHQMTRPVCLLRLGESWDATRAGFSRNAKESLRRSRNRLTKSGANVEIVEFANDLDRTTVDRFINFHAMRSAEQSRIRHHDAYSEERERNLMRDLLPRLGRARRAAILELRLDGTPIAAQLVLYAPNTLYIHSSGFDPATWSMGPVVHLQGEAMRRACEEGRQWVNLSPGITLSKLRWGAHVHPFNDFAFGVGSRGAARRFELFSALKTVNQVRASTDQAAVNAAPPRAK